jgi:(p)ppGpp synthase/HD superfamily hydrolase
VPHAQTNLQLFNQLSAAGWGEPELDRAGRAYEFAMELFTGQFRSNGKPFLAHLVGTASALAAAERPPPVVLAGLLHAVYAQGEWGDGRSRVAEERRARIREVAGAAVEDLVHRYTVLAWNEHTIPELRARADQLAGPAAEVVAMRLANLLDDYVDRGMAYSHKGEKAKLFPPHLADAVELAERLGLTQLAADLRRVFAENAEAELPPTLVREGRSSFTLAPLSHALKPALTLRNAAKPARKAVRRALSSVSRQASS